MRNYYVRWLSVVVVVLAIVLLFRLLSDDRANRDRHAERIAPQAALQSSASASATRAAPAARLPAGVRSTPPGSSASRNASTTNSSAPDVRFELLAPSDIQVGESFEVRVHVDASLGVRRLLFAVEYDPSRLTLLDMSKGNFAQQTGLIARFESDEPSDGTVRVTFVVADGQAAAGVGAIAVLQFQALDAGTSTITMHDLSGLDAKGANSLNIALAREAIVTAR